MGGLYAIIQEPRPTFLVPKYFPCLMCNFQGGPGHQYSGDRGGKRDWTLHGSFRGSGLEVALITAS